MPEEKQFCTFTLQGHLFGIHVLQVQEVFRYQEMTSVPLAPPTIRGLLNLRGQIITAIDLRRLLNLEEREEHAVPMNIVVRSADGAVSLLVDAIGDVLEVGSDQFELPPETLQDALKKRVRGVYKLDGRLLLVLDMDQVIRQEQAA